MADFLSIDNDGGVKGYLGYYEGGCGIGYDPISDGINHGVAIMSAPEGDLVTLADYDGDGKVSQVRLHRSSG